MKPLAEEASKGNVKRLRSEIESLKYNIKKSELYKNICNRYKGNPNEEIYFNSLKPDYIAEKALMFLFNEQNLVSEDLLVRFVNELSLNREYMTRTLADNRRPVSLDQGLLF